MSMYDKKVLDELREAVIEWEKKHQDEFKAERKTFVTESGIPIKRVYTPLDLEEKGFNYLKDLGLPGEYPYTRNNSSTGYRSRLWTISHYSGHATPEECNRLWKEAVKSGARIVSAAYDLPSQLGIDADDPRAEGEVGRVGISVCSQQDWEVAWDGIDFSKIGPYGAFNAPAIISLAAHINIADQQGVSQKDMPGLLQNDILKEFMARGNYIFPPAPSMRLVADTLYYTGTYMPKYQAITVCGVHQSEKGANCIHEAAFALADAFAYLQASVDMGVDVDVVAPGIMFLPGCDHYVFWEEIAKLRAMRRIYAKVLKGRFKAKKPASIQCRLYAAGGGTALYREQYLNNIARSTLATVVGAFSGCELIDVRSYDEQFGIPSTEAVINTIRFINVVQRETGVTDTVDPLGGSYFVESLTMDTEERIWKELEEIDRRGGIINCIETGYAQRVIAEDGYKWLRAFERGEIERVGVNIFRSEGEEQRPMRIYRADPKVGEIRKAQVAELRRKRDNAKVKKALEEVKAVARLEAKPENNLVPPVREACKVYATVGEICDALREVWGEYREISIL